MKKINYKKLFKTSAWVLVVVALVFSLGFVAKKERKIIASSMSINILNNEENLFLTEADITTFFEERKDSILNTSYKNINLPELEKALNTHPAIENSEVSATLNGEINVEITQRTPVLRVINKSGESYYIDSQAKLMPLNSNYSARVLVVNGELNEPYDRRHQFTVTQIKNHKLFSQVSLLDDVLEVGNYIRNDSALTQLIHQIYVNEDKEIELFPSIGCQRIILGNSDQVAEKFNKLKLFYTQGLNKSDAWKKYSVINLKYKNLVVCTKK